MPTRVLKSAPLLGLLLFFAHAVSAQSAAGSHYKIDLDKSDIHWLVYRAGALARLGHNHVVAVGKLDKGDVYVAPVLADSRFEMDIPVADLVIDNPEMRAKQGEGFEKQPSAGDIAGTRNNMLTKVLLAQMYPTLKITGTGPVGSPGAEQMHMTVEILGHPVQLTVPTNVKIEGDTLEASGKFKLTHEQLGMKPFSIMMGALQVADQMDFSYHVIAHRVE